MHTLQQCMEMGTEQEPTRLTEENEAEKIYAALINANSLDFAPTDSNLVVQ